MMSEHTDEGSASAEEAGRIREAVRKVGQAQGFPLFKLYFGRDSTGDEAVWIYFDLDPSYASGRQEISRLDSLATAVKEAIFRIHTPLVPYVRFREGNVARAR